MCGPSGKMKQLNNQIASFSSTMVDEAKTIFGDASSMFNTISGSVGKIIAGGQNQMGWGAAKSAAVTASIVNAAAASARNIKAATGNAIAAIGGGNIAMPSGLATAANLSAEESVEQAKTQQLEQATVANADAGTENYWKAIQAGENAPNMLTVANTANTNAESGLKTAQQSQQSIDSANNWWQPLVLKGIGAAASLATGGMSNFALGGFGKENSSSAYAQGETPGDVSAGFGGSSSVPTGASELPWSIT